MSVPRKVRKNQLMIVQHMQSLTNSIEATIALRWVMKSVEATYQDGVNVMVYIRRRFSRLNLTLTFRLLILSCLSLSLSSCATYSTGFNCSGGRGANCVMLSEVDRRVTSGEIETVYFDKKCKNGRCKEAQDTPEQQFGTNPLKIELVEPAKTDYQDEEYVISNQQQE